MSKIKGNTKSYFTLDLDVSDCFSDIWKLW